MSNGLVKDRVKFFENFTKANKDATKKAKKSPKKTEQPCPLPEFELVELVEVVTQDKEKWVKGAGMPTTEITEHVERTDKDGEHFKQYINLEKDTETQDKRHPEYGREITFKARVKRKDDKTESLHGVKVTFKSKCTKAANRASPDAAIWSDANANFTDNDQKEGFGSKGGGDTTSANTDGKGWTTMVTFYLSQYGGDQFEISAELHPSVKGASGAQPKKTKKYIVWRKFWYQMTYGDYKYDGTNNYAPPVPQKAKEAYAEVFAEMVKAKLDIKKFKDTDITNADLKKRTFVKEYMVKKGGRADKVPVIGYHNTDLFKAMRPNTAHKLTTNLIIAEYQCDSVDADCATTVSVFELTGPSQEVTVTDAKIVCDPPLKAGKNLVISGEWSKTDESPPTHWNKEANLTDSDIEIHSTRSALNKIKVKRPSGATVGDKVYIKLKILATKSFSGCAAGDGQVVCVYKGVPSGSGSEKDFNETVVHELGHLFNQTPESADKPASMKAHPLQYVAHGGSGSHCRDGATASVKKGTSGLYIASQNAKTKITKKAVFPTNTHKVADTTGFIENHKVKVKNSEKILSRVDETNLKLKFTTRFRSNKDDEVEQSLTFSPVDWTNKNQDYPIPWKGTCVMYHQSSTTCTSKFCKTCKAYMQLQKMESFK